MKQDILFAMMIVPSSTPPVEANFLIGYTQKGSLSKAQGTTCVGLDNLEGLSFF
jgi:hypothetical protein